MRLATIDQAAQIDELSQKVYGLSDEVLMESAGCLATREIDLTFLPELTRGAVAVVAGPGNNGGDALVVARHLHSSGHRNLNVLLAAPSKNRSEMFKLQLKRAELQGLRIFDGLDEPAHLELIRSATLVVDGLFGIGLNRAISDPYLRVIEVMNSSKAPKVSLDTPSGLNAGSGRIEGLAVRAAMTISFGLAKPGFFVSEGPAHTGKLRVLSIGFPYEALRGVATSHFLFTEKLARRYLPIRRESSNKSDHGHLVVMAGSPGYWGAGILASSAAYRMGSGYVTWASFESPQEVLKEIPEVLTAHVHDDSIWNGRLSAVAIGPGLGVSNQTAELIERLKEMKGLAVVVDADAITTCVEHALFPLPSNWVVTPHAGELARMLRLNARDLERDRFHACAQACELTKCHVLLKGFRSIIAYNGRYLVIHAGNSALAKAGTGDVLTGMIGALMAQGLDTTMASATAAYLHGRLADEWIRSGQDKSSLTASDLKALLPQIVARLRMGGTLF